MSDVKVVIPVYRSPISADERISLETIFKRIPESRILLVAPRSLDVSSIMSASIAVERFEEEFFSGISGYNKLLTSSLFYERFLDLTHILICQLDCLILNDELDEWVSKGYDYLAAPWFKKFENDSSSGLWRVGNGGFSLRRVQSHIRVLRQKTIRGAIYPKHGNTPWIPTEPDSETGIYQKLIPWYRQINPFEPWVTVEDELVRYPQNEDLFWSLEAPKFDATFKVAPAMEALPFAFEMDPRWCYEANGRRLPFGCHAWARYDRAFWEQFLLR